MQAVRIHSFGGTEVLTLEDVPKPEPGDYEVLVRVQAASVNPVDYKIRSGKYLPADQLPLTLGRDMCGTIEKCGRAVTGYTEGDAVFAMLPTDRGGHAEYVVANVAHCAPKPERLDPIHAAAVPLAALTAWQGLFDHGRLKGGQRVLVHGAAGGVGHFAVQFAKAYGATVYATCSEGDLEWVRSLGVDKAIDYKNQRFEDEVPEVDLVYDLVAGETQDRSWSVLKQGGVLVSTLTEPSADKAREHGAEGTRYTAHADGRQLVEIGRLIDAGRVRVQVDKVFALEEAAEAEHVLEDEHVRGKVVLKVA
ncbi:NADP-dependent oxidoreductase [Nitrospirillum amazonense]|uniref:NADP-dependent oxidoreductase n=1 Tax=Nitrospirillum amazonense TaxID=28077 RepID=UPI002412A4BD|nr:NADP-dependent oxidoreductase [Nitrospirillum amazonense]MDG3439497.1 NADP-dependent oxidoreductase [Nitrospirillum amazonense]